MNKTQENAIKALQDAAAAMLAMANEANAQSGDVFTIHRCVSEYMALEGKARTWTRRLGG